MSRAPHTHTYVHNERPVDLVNYKVFVASPKSVIGRARESFARRDVPFERAQNALLAVSARGPCFRQREKKKERERRLERCHVPDKGNCCVFNRWDAYAGDGTSSSSSS
ncbi:hypothetical protein TSAR_008330, partial [Trichomalopsis sarcophagae]